MQEREVLLVATQEGVTSVVVPEQVGSAVREATRKLEFRQNAIARRAAEQ